MRALLPVSMMLAIAGGAFAAHAEMKLPDLKKQASPQAVLDEHLDALSKCDWNRLLAQYPDDAQINLPGGTIVKGRAAIGDLFAGFCKDPKDGGQRDSFRSRSKHDYWGYACDPVGGDRPHLGGAVQGI